MNRILFAGLIAAALTLTPAYAATHKKAKHHPKTAVVKKASSIEDQAWSGAANHSKKTTAKKLTAKKPGGLAPTVKLVHEDVPNPVVQPAVKPTTDIKPVPATGDNKTATDLEKAAKTLARKNPKQALDTYAKLVAADPNYAYAGDVYADMYRLSVRSGGDVLDQLKYAGMASQKLDAGLSRGPVDPAQVKQFQQIEEHLENQWIQTEMQKILSGKE